MISDEAKKVTYCYMERGSGVAERELNIKAMQKIDPLSIAYMFYSLSAKIFLVASLFDRVLNPPPKVLLYLIIQFFMQYSSSFNNNS